MPDFASVLTVTGGRVADLSATFAGCEWPIKFSHTKNTIGVVVGKGAEADFQDILNGGLPEEWPLDWECGIHRVTIITEQKSEDSLKLRYTRLFLDSEINNLNDIIMQWCGWPEILTPTVVNCG